MRDLARFPVRISRSTPRSPHSRPAGYPRSQRCFLFPCQSPAARESGNIRARFLPDSRRGHPLARKTPAAVTRPDDSTLTEARIEHESPADLCQRSWGGNLAKKLSGRSLRAGRSGLPRPATTCLQHVAHTQPRILAAGAPRGTTRQPGRRSRRGWSPSGGPGGRPRSARSPHRWPTSRTGSTPDQPR